MKRATQSHLFALGSITVLIAGLSMPLRSAEPEKVDTSANEPVERLADFTVTAGRMPTGTSPGAILNTVEVLSTPGATADINRALQTFPGVQQVDEGNALFVRGGDSFETATLVNGIRHPSATRINAPTGSFSGTLDPMQARAITFLNGGLGAQYGNILSGVVDLATRSAPSSSSATLNLGLGALGATGNMALGHGAGFRATAVRSSISPIVGLNGSRHDFEEEPNGHDLSLAAGWTYRPGGELRSYLLEQQNRVSLRVDMPDLKGLYASRVQSRLGTLTWNDQFGKWRWTGNAGGNSLRRDEETTLGNISTQNSQKQLNVSTTYDVSGKMALTGGVDYTAANFSLEKSKMEAGLLRSFRRELDDTRWGGYVQADAVVIRHVRAVVGGRLDHSSLADETTVDPRVSLSWEPRRDLSFSLAGGAYHQVPDGYYFINSEGKQVRRSAMRAQDAVVAVEYRHDLQVFRVEAYQKQYSALAQTDRNHLPTANNGFGSARGADFFIKTPLPNEFTGRLTYSYVNADRTDPNTGLMATTPWGVAHSVSIVLERTICEWHVSLGWRYASGRPVTPIVGATPASDGGWVPVYGEPYSDRLRTFQRVDALLYRVWFLKGGRSMTTYISINNLFNRANVYGYSYSDDYTRRWNSPSLFNRVLYAGAMINFN